MAARGEGRDSPGCADGRECLWGGVMGRARSDFWGMLLRCGLPGRIILCVCAFLLSAAPGARGSVCSAVQLRLSQDVAMERQSFLARLVIHNALPDLTVEDVAVQVSVADALGNPVSVSSDPESKDADFFLGVSRIEGIGAVDGTSDLPSGQSGDISWTIIPAVGAGGQDGVLYQVSADLCYRVAGTTYAVQTAPEWITVSPMPDLHLDFFLPADVCGDDPLTTEVEPSLPFSLGLRIANNGSGPARNLELSVEPPVIVQNDLGLLIAFAMERCEIDGVAQVDDLDIRTGNLAPSAVCVAEWFISSPLSGHCTNFGVSVTHSDALGGQLTALIRSENVRSHDLLHGVVCEGQGRDGRVDFLGADHILYESNGENTPVAEVQGYMAGAVAAEVWELQVPPTTGQFFHASAWLSGPVDAARLLVRRDDGVMVREENRWVSGSRAEDGKWNYRFHLFGTSPPHSSYTIDYMPVETDTNRAPQILPLAGVTVLTNTSVNVEVRAVDPDGTTPVLSADQLPAGSRFTNGTNGDGSLSWRPGSGQIGTYRVKVIASDGKLSVSDTVRITVLDTLPAAPPGAIFILR